ncbi:hypothetical protein [Neorhizobium galegae]|uniref:hypothetical protein n=1 Tax=Neorhizobium galegae TaxID=399 RepID=UPI0006225951|nr:hypothetical protein [Neorhizobium galegae]MCQ1809425.1 hypothetical protein [Neorhizobium galegae]CDZ63638.1 Hypothetical protein NGAL_HAMBI2566_56600 [Neorhizobium galegae bv. orientalis]
MKRLVITAAAVLSLSANLTFAQETPNASPSTPPQAERDRTSNAPPPGPREPAADRDGDEWRMPPMADRRPPRERGARFRIENGRTTIDLRCADGEPTKDCADLLLQVLDRLERGASSDDSDSRDDGRDRSRYR